MRADATVIRSARSVIERTGVPFSGYRDLWSWSVDRVRVTSDRSDLVAGLPSSRTAWPA